MKTNGESDVFGSYVEYFKYPAKQGGMLVTYLQKLVK